MARIRTRRAEVKRDTTAIANAPRSRALLHSVINFPLRRPFLDLLAVADARRFDPTHRRPGFQLKTISGTPARATVPSRSFLTPTIAFRAPDRVVVCVRRQRRREVLFAKRRLGAGARLRKPRWKYDSYISCRR